MADISVSWENCKGCGLCGAFCPKRIIEMSEGLNSKGHHPAMVTEPEKCNGCGLCAMMCPDVAIEINVRAGDEK